MADIKIICRRDQWQVKMKEVIARDRLFLYKDRTCSAYTIFVAKENFDHQGAKIQRVIFRASACIMDDYLQHEP